MRGCLRVLIMFLTLCLMIVLGLQTYALLEGKAVPSTSEMFEIVVYGTCFFVCIAIEIEMIKWR